jgi:hypothetical protein
MFFFLAFITFYLEKHRSNLDPSDRSVQQPAGNVDLDLHENSDFDQVETGVPVTNADPHHHFWQCVSGSSILGNANPDLVNDDQKL